MNLSNNLDLKDPKENMALASLSIYYKWKNIKSECSNSEFKISSQTWNDTFDLPDRSYSISDIQLYFEFIIKKHGTLTENLPVQIYVNRINNRIVFKIKTGYKLELLTPEKKKRCWERLKWRKCTKIIEVVLFHYNLLTNDYQDTSKVLY